MSKKYTIISFLFHASLAFSSFLVNTPELPKNIQIEYFENSVVGEKEADLSDTYFNDEMEAGEQELNIPVGRETAQSLEGITEQSEVSGSGSGSSSNKIPCKTTYKGVGLKFDNSKYLFNNTTYLKIILIGTGSPAEKAGLVVGDYIELGIYSIQDMKVGTSSYFKVFSKGKEFQVLMTSSMICRN